MSGMSWPERDAIEDVYSDMMLERLEKFCYVAIEESEDILHSIVISRLPRNHFTTAGHKVSRAGASRRRLRSLLKIQSSRIAHLVATSLHARTLKTWISNQSIH